jgi:5-(carboxyamino)imidazole ribonucleotide synthase
LKNGARAKQKALQKLQAMSDLMGVIPPGSTIGILGGGQLGRMTSLAAARLGYCCHIFAPDENNPASQVAAKTTTADYDDLVALNSFADQVDVVTLEFENVPRATLEHLSERLPVRPSADVLSIAQNRLVEKNYLRSIGVATADFADVRDLSTLSRAVGELGHNSILKSAAFGYDGKGQVALDEKTDLASAFEEMGSAQGILEKKIDFACEISVIVARSVTGKVAAYSPVENRHVHHILDTTIAPARVAVDVIANAEAIAKHIVEQLQVIGLLAVEMFVTLEGTVLVNEIAPRPHNSGHWTIDACQTSQFEQLVRAVTGLPLGSTERRADAIMKNLIGGDVEKWPALADDPYVFLHLYGKAEARPGRKMGHITRLFKVGTALDE